MSLWRLHRHLFAEDRAQAVLFGGPDAPSVICRSSQAKERVEWQADFYASCLLMPRKLVFAAWDEAFSRPQAAGSPAYHADRPPFHRDPPVRVPYPGRRTQRKRRSGLERFAKPFAEKFLVSRIAPTGSSPPSPDQGAT